MGAVSAARLTAATRRAKGRPRRGHEGTWAEHAGILARVSTLYHVCGKRQHEIAAEVGASRPTVSRLLREAWAAGIVRVSVSPSPGHAIALESALEVRFGLRAVRVVLAESSDLPARRREIGAAVAADLTRSVQPRHRIGIACGDLLTAAVDALAPMATVGVEVVQAVGWTGDVSASLGAMDLVERLARRIGGAAVLLPAPGVVTTEAVRRRLEADQHVAAALRALDTLDTLYVEIAWLGDAEIAGVRRALGGSSAGTAVGTVAQRHFDARGTFLRTAADRRVIGVTVEQMRRARHVVAVASAPDDAPAVAAALRTGIVRTLITDEPTARAVAELDARDTTARRHPRRLNS